MSSVPWSWPALVGFRFAFVYFVTYIATGIPVLSGPFRTPVHMVANAVLRLAGYPGELPAGSGSLGNDFPMAVGALVIAAVATPIWSLLARQRTNYDRLHLWLRWAIRYFVLGTMVIYGAAKVMQFGPAPLSQMLQPIGSLTPMGVLWLFMGTSKGYALFAGACEMIGGLLLLSTRTTLLGALVCAGVMSNVWLMNMLYDVPVRVLSFHLLLMSTFLLLPDLRRLLNFFVLNRATAPGPETPLFGSAVLSRAGNVARALLIVGVVGFTIGLARFSAREVAESPLQGAWFVERFELNGVERPAMASDAERWHRLVIDRPGVVAIQKMDASMERFTMSLEPGNARMKLGRLGNSRWSAEFSVEAAREASPETLTLTGILDGAKITAWARRDALSAFPLVAGRER